MYLHDLSSGERRAEFPLEVGTISGLSGQKGDTELFYSFQSYVTPCRIYRCDMTQETLNPEVSALSATLAASVLNIFIYLIKPSYNIHTLPQRQQIYQMLNI